MKEVVTKIGDVEVTPGVAQFLECMFMEDIAPRYAVHGYIEELRCAQDYLTRLAMGFNLSGPDEGAMACLSVVMSVKDMLSLLLQGKEANHDPAQGRP